MALDQTNTIALLLLITLLTVPTLAQVVSHYPTLQAVVPYGGSANTISTLPSGIFSFALNNHLTLN